MEFPDRGVFLPRLLSLRLSLRSSETLAVRTLLNPAPKAGEVLAMATGYSADYLPDLSSKEAGKNTLAHTANERRPSGHA